MYYIIRLMKTRFASHMNNLITLSPRAVKRVHTTKLRVIWTTPCVVGLASPAVLTTICQQLTNVWNVAWEANRTRILNTALI